MRSLHRIAAVKHKASFNERGSPTVRTNDSPVQESIGNPASSGSLGVQTRVESIGSRRTSTCFHFEQRRWRHALRTDLLVRPGMLHREGPVKGLVERFDIESYSDFSSKWSNFIRLVLCCIGAKCCKKVFVGKLLTRSTRFTCFCTAQTSIFQKFFVNFFRIFWQNFAKIRYFWILFTDFCSDFDEILSEFRR